MAGQHVEVVLDVLPDLEDRVAFQQRLQQRDRRGPVDLRRAFGEHVGAAVAERDVAGIVGAQREADPDQLGLHRVEHAGLGIDREPARGEGPVDPCCQPLGGLHAFIGCQIDRRHRRQVLPAATRRGRGCGGLRLGGVELGLGSWRGLSAVEPPQQAGEAMLFEECGQRRLGDRAQREIVERHRQRAVFLELDQPARQSRHVGLLDQAVAQLAGLHRGGSGEHRLEAAMLLDQLGRGLGADPADARHVVDTVAHQRQHVAHQFGRHAELLDHLGNGDPQVLHRVEHVDIPAAGRVAARLTRGAAADQLHQVLVGRDDRHVPAAPRGRAGIRRDHVVGFEIVFLDAGQAECAGRVADQRELRHEIFRRRRAIGLVLIVHRVAERSPGLVEDHREVSRPIGMVEVLGQPPQHRGVAIDRADRHALRVGQRGQAVIGPENVGRTVDQIEVLLRRCHGRLPITPGGRRQSRGGLPAA